MENNNNQNNQNVNTEPNGGQPVNNTGITKDDLNAITQSLLGAIENRQKRAENSVVNSMAEQYGMKPEELTKLLTDARAAKQKELPQEALDKIAQADDRANKAEQQVRTMTIKAELARIGAAMGLQDEEVALSLIGESIKLNDKGAVEGMKEALDDLKTKKPYLFAQKEAQNGAWAGRLAGTGGDDGGMAAMRKAMGLPPLKKE